MKGPLRRRARRRRRRSPAPPSRWPSPRACCPPPVLAVDDAAPTVAADGLTRLRARRRGSTLECRRPARPVVSAPPADGGGRGRRGCTSSAPTTAARSTTPSRSASPPATRRCWPGCIPPVSPATCWASLKCDCGPQLRAALAQMGEAGAACCSTSTRKGAASGWPTRCGPMRCRIRASTRSRRTTGWASRMTSAISASAPLILRQLGSPRFAC